MTVKKLLSLSTALTLLSLNIIPVNAEQLQAMACNTTTGDCYNATIETDLGQVTIKKPGLNNLILSIDDNDPDYINAYDNNDKAYYDIEIIPIGE